MNESRTIVKRERSVVAKKEPGDVKVKYWEITARDAYVRVFDLMIQEVDHELLDPRLISEYSALTVQSRSLVTRFYLRTWKWVKKHEMRKYMHPDKLTEALDELVKTGWLLDRPGFSELLDVATVKELQEVVDHFNVAPEKAGQTKSDLVDALRAFVSQKNFFTTSFKDKVVTKLIDGMTRCYKLNEDKAFKLFRRLEIMYLCPAMTGVDTVLRSHMKMVKFSNYEYHTQKESPIFTCRQDFEDYFEARRLCDPLEELSALTSDNFLNDVSLMHASVACTPGPYSASYVYGRGIWLLSQLLMKSHRFQLEYDWVQKYLDQKCHKSKIGPALIRKLLLELRFHQETGTKKETVWLNRALNTYYDATGTVNEIDALDLERKAVKLWRELKAIGVRDPPIPIKRPPTPGSDYGFKVNEIEGTLRDNSANKSRKTLWGREGDTVHSVEDTALDHYIKQGWSGGHYENSLLSTIFWLCIWDLAFADKSDFKCPFQSQPMNLPAVLHKHREEIIDRFTWRNSPYRRIEQSYKDLVSDKPQIGGINWSIPLNDILAVVHGLNKRLEPIMKRQVENRRLYASGFPDLTLWNLTSGAIKVVEVKSENDTISDNQRLWIEFMLNIDIDVEICRVLHKDRKKRKKK